MEIRGVVEGWPTLMSLELASRYLSIDEETFRNLAGKQGVHPVDIEGSRPRWRKQDIDRLVRQLPISRLQNSDERLSSLVRIEDRQLAALADAVARRLAPDPGLEGRKLVSIKEASAILGVGRSSVYRMIEDGRLETTHIGRRTLVKVDTINAIIGPN